MTAPSCHCSLCGRSNTQVAVMLAGPAHVFICDDCVEACVPAEAAE